MAPKIKKPANVQTLEQLMFVPNEQTDNPDSPSNELSLKIIDHIFNKDDIEVKTDLNNQQIITFSKAKVYSQRYNCSIIDELVSNICTYSISKDRKSRKEFTEISKAFNSMQGEDVVPSIRGRLLGKE
jgi:hypothetical protein